MDGKFVIKCDCFLEDGKLNIVMQFAPNGTLHSRLHAQRGKALPEEKVWKFFIQALLGLRHVHSKKIIHRDMKSLNLFFDAEDNVLVGDLGIAKVLSPNTMFARTIVGTPSLPGALRGQTVQREVRRVGSRRGAVRDVHRR